MPRPTPGQRCKGWHSPTPPGRAEMSKEALTHISWLHCAKECGTRGPLSRISFFAQNCTSTPASVQTAYTSWKRTTHQAASADISPQLRSRIKISHDRTPTLCENPDHAQKDASTTLGEWLILSIGRNPPSQGGPVNAKISCHSTNLPQSVLQLLPQVSLVPFLALLKMTRHPIRYLTRANALSRLGF